MSLGSGDLGCVSSSQGCALTYDLILFTCSRLILPANSEIAAFLLLLCMSLSLDM